MLPIEMEFLAKDRTTREDDIMAADIVWQAEKIANLKHKIHAKAKLNIEAAQEKDKMYCDKKHTNPKVCTSQLCVCVCVWVSVCVSVCVN